MRCQFKNIRDAHDANQTVATDDTYCGYQFMSRRSLYAENLSRFSVAQPAVTNELAGRGTAIVGVGFSATFITPSRCDENRSSAASMSSSPKWCVTSGVRSTRPLATIEINRRMRADLWLAIEAGKLSLPIHKTYKLADIGEALALMHANRHFGKVVISVS